MWDIIITNNIFSFEFPNLSGNVRWNICSVNPMLYLPLMTKVRFHWGWRHHPAYFYWSDGIQCHHLITMKTTMLFVKSIKCFGNWPAWTCRKHNLPYENNCITGWSTNALYVTVYVCIQVCSCMPTMLGCTAITAGHCAHNKHRFIV